MIVPISLYKFIRQKLIRLREILCKGNDVASLVECDFWLVCHQKDYATAKLTLESIRRFSLNPVNKIFFISNLELRPSWLESDIDYIYEMEIEGIERVSKILHSCSYRGWIIQQILKYSGISYSNRFVSIDCDTVLLRPHLFYYGEKTVLRLAYEYSPIYRPFEKKLEISALNHLSFVCHMMPFHRTILQKLLKQIELKTDFVWYEGIAHYAETRGMVISEWDLYAKFLIHNQSPFTLRPWKNQTVTYDENISLENLISQYGRARLSVSLHRPGGPLVLK